MSSNYQDRDISLLKQIRAGDMEAMEAMLTQYKGLVRVKAASMYMAGADSDDIMQEGMIGLFKAIRDYNPDLGVPFSSFAGYCIMAQITDAVRQASRLKHKPLNDSVSLQSVAGSDTDVDIKWQDMIAAQNQHDPEQLLILQEKQSTLQSFIRDQLSELERKIVLLYLQSLSYQQIASVLGCSVKSVDNALGRVRKKMKGFRQSDRHGKEE